MSEPARKPPIGEFVLFVVVMVSLLFCGGLLVALRTVTRENAVLREQLGESEATVESMADANQKHWRQHQQTIIEIRRQQRAGATAATIADTAIEAMSGATAAKKETR